MTRRRLAALAAGLALGACAAFSASAAGQERAGRLPFADAQPLDSPRLARLERAVDSRARGAALTSFWTDVRRDGAPIVEPVAGEPDYSWVTFVWRAMGKTSNVVVVDGVAAGVGGAQPEKSTMRHLDGTDVWYRTYKIRNDAAFTYTLSPNDSLEPLTGPRKSRPQIDPLNPNRSGPQSTVRLPAAPMPAEAAQPPQAPAGSMTRSLFMSTVLENTRTLQVYTPPDFVQTGTPYPLLVMLDSGAYADYVPIAAMLDALIARKRIAPLVAVLVGNVDRDSELKCSPRYADFLALELVPWLRDTYRAGVAADRTIVGGSSLGGLAAAFAAFRHPEVFGNLLAQSASYWWAPADGSPPEWLTRQYAAADPRGIRVSMSVGAMEIPQQLDTNRRMRDALAAKGYRLDYVEFNGNHSYYSWRSDLANRLEELAPGMITRKPL